MENRKDAKIFGQSTNLIIGIAVLIIFFLGLTLITRAIFYIFYSWFAIVILAAAAIIDYKVIVEYVSWLARLLKKNTPVGIAAAIGSAIGYPFVFTYLLAKAALRKKLIGTKGKRGKRAEEDYIDFEEVDSKPLDLPEMRKDTDSYDDVFEKE